MRDLFRMRYFRFRATDLDKTIDFYTVFGMGVEYDVEMERVFSPMQGGVGMGANVGGGGGGGLGGGTTHSSQVGFGQQGNAAARSTRSPPDRKMQMSSAGGMKKHDPSIGSMTKLAAPQLAEEDLKNELGPVRCVAMSYRVGGGQGNSSGESNSDRIQLVFEEDLVAKTKKPSIDFTNAAEGDPATAANPNDMSRPYQDSSQPPLSQQQQSSTHRTSVAERPKLQPIQSKLGIPQAQSQANAIQTMADATQASSDEPDSYIKHIDRKTPHNYEYLVVYVHFIQRLIKRFMSKGYEVLLQPMEIENAKLAILKDPNGLEVRLLDMSETQLNEGNNRKQWFTRLGYYAVPTSNADETTLMYEQLFQIRAPKSGNGRGGGGGGGGGLGGGTTGGGMRDMIDPITGKSIDPNDAAAQSRNLRKIGPAGIVRQAMTKAAGFRIVDMEEFVVGLKNTVFYWLGNDIRTNACTICLTEVSNADTGIAITSFNKSTSPLIGIGFEVPNLDAVVNKLKYETKDQLEWINARFKLPGLLLFEMQNYCEKHPLYMF
eukprot:jgi/Hompol1/4382/HPOL_003610-RA